MDPVKPELLPDDVAGIARAADLLRAGFLVGLPTETVYGLAADARNPDAVARIFAAKGRPDFNPLIVHVATLAEAEELVDFASEARLLAKAFWPGALTLVLPSRGRVAAAVAGGLPTLAVRVPAHPVAQAVLAAFGGPIAAPSANLSGRISPTTAAHVVAGLGPRVDAVLDGGPCAVGLESTIVAVGQAGIRLLREGGITREAVEALVGPVVADLTPGRTQGRIGGGAAADAQTPAPARVEAPGQLERHYAPRTRLAIGGTARPGEVMIGFGAVPGDLTLSETGDLAEAAGQLFAALHTADALAQTRGARLIRVAEVPEEGLGRAINDRLRRAAKGRSASKPRR